MITKIWVLSLCSINEGGGDVEPADVFLSKEKAERYIKKCEKNPHMCWGLMDYCLEEVDLTELEGYSE